MSKMDYKSIALQAGITAMVVAVVNKLMNPVVKGLGAGEKLMLGTFSMERMAQFADMATVVNVNNKAFLDRAFSSIDENDPNFYLSGNQTTIGNCAFVALNTKYPEYRQKATMLLNNYKKYANGQF
jgi:hypothetical protein